MPSIYSSFLAQAKAYPDKIALVDRTHRLTYQELATAVDLCAGRLNQAGTNRTLVAVCLDRSLDLVVANLAVLAAGSSCLPLDPKHPPRHLRQVIRNAGADQVVTSTSHQSLFEGIDVPIVEFNKERIAGSPIPAAEVRGHEAAFIIYTSGSTGQPKGVQLADEACMTMIESLARRFQLADNAQLLHFAAPAFDSSTLEWMLALTQGATLHLAPDELRDAPKALSEFMIGQGITHALLPAALLPYLPLSDRYALTALAVIGDVCPEETLWRWAERYSVFNGYGPTESVICTSLTAVIPGQPISIEHTLDAIQLRLVDANGKDSSEGEILIGGDQLALGYHKASSLTEAAFFEDGEQRRWYRSGDRAERTTDGRLIFLGRRDHQVKIRGHRVELAAIEQQLRAFDGVRNAQVIVDASGPEKCLRAFLASDEPADRLTERVRRMLAAELPAYYSPSSLTVMPDFPLTPNGKIDRAALLATLTTNALPDDPLAALFCAELGCSSISEDTDFFKAGGNSIALIRLLNAIGQQLKTWLSPGDFRQGPTLSAVRKRVRENHAPALPVIQPGLADLNRPHPLTPQQNTAWYMHQSAPDSKAYLAEAAISFTGPLDKEALEIALNRVIARHSIYRTIFMEENGEPIQRVVPEYRYSLPFVDRPGLDTDFRKREIKRLLKTELPGVDRLDQLPLARFLLIRFDSNHHVLLHQEHHIIHDGWGGNAFTEEVMNFYHAEVVPDFVFQPPESPQYLDFAHQQEAFLKGPEGQRQLAYWRAQLNDCPQGTSVFGKQSHSLGFEGAVARRTVSRAHWAELEAQCRELGLSMFGYTSAVVLLCLARYSQQDDVTLGSAFANRHWGNSQSILGMMVNTLVLRQPVKPDMTVRDWLLAVQATVEDAQANDAYPFGRVVAELNPPRSGGNPYFNVLLGFHDAPLNPTLPPGLGWSKDETMESATSKFDIDCLVVPRQGNFNSKDEVHFLWEYRSDVYSDGEIEIFLDGFESVFSSALTSLNKPLAELTAVPEAHYERLLQWGQGPTLDYPKTPLTECLRQLAREQPDKTALVDAGGCLSYASLVSEAEQLASRLKQAGLTPGALTALELPRGNKLVAAMLGVWFAGGSVMVLDPDLPPVRRALIVDQAKPSVYLRVDGELSPASESTPTQTARAEQAYVIFTSGSTGKPKGVEVGHAGFLNLCQAHRELFDLTPATRGISLAHPGFDAYMAEVWPVLLSGGCVVSLEDAERNDLDILQRRLEEEAITHACLSTGLFEAALATDFLWPDSLATLLTGGDRLGSVQLPTDRRFRLFNMYGPTETTVDALAYEVTDSRTAPPIGRPIANASACILDANGQLCPIGAEGDLWIGGQGVALGYLGDEAQTRQAFCQAEQLNPQLKGRYYRTGDRARWSTEGQIEFMGRRDDEVKIRGYRVDLSEIAAQLAADEKVAQATCRYQDDTLLAYVVPAPEVGRAIREEGFSRQKLARHLGRALRRSLPDYMRPSSILVLDEFPLTPQGKLDKAALPSPLQSEEAEVAPSTELERKISGIWCEFLARDRVSVTDSFFAIGGHSLLAIKILNRMRQQLGVTMQMEDFFNHFTVRDQARYVEAVESLTKGTSFSGEVTEEGSL